MAKAAAKERLGRTGAMTEEPQRKAVTRSSTC